MLGDVAVAVNPDDERYAELVGKEVTLPLTGRTIPVIADAYVDKEFGTGCVKITPAHDFNDWQIGQRHGLAPIAILDLDATINDNAPAKYRGLDRYAARKAVLADLAAQGLVVSEKPHKMVVPRCGRTGEIVEPMLTDQWFVAMTHAGAGDASVLPGQDDPGPVPRRGRRRRDEPARPARPARSSSCPTNGCRRTCTGSTTSRTGASRASSGGAIGFRRGTTRRATSTSRATRPRRARKARAKLGREPATLRAGRRRARHVVLLGAVVPFDARLAGEPSDAANAARRSCRRRARHRLRHHLLLGRADDHDDDLLHRRGAVPRRLHQRDRARRGRPEDVEVEGQRPRPARPDRRHRRSTRWSRSARAT